MARIQKSMRLYSHPFSLAYWRDAALELRDTKMLVITALMVALRIALKPAAIPLGPSLYIQTATLATALGAMIFGTADDELLQLNENTLYSGSPESRWSDLDITPTYPKMVSLLESGNYLEAAELLKQ